MMRHAIMILFLVIAPATYGMDHRIKIPAQEVLKGRMNNVPDLPQFDDITSMSSHYGSLECTVEGLACCVDASIAVYSALVWMKWDHRLCTQKDIEKKVALVKSRKPDIMKMLLQDQPELIVQLEEKGHI